MGRGAFLIFKLAFSCFFGAFAVFDFAAGGVAEALVAAWAADVEKEWELVGILIRVTIVAWGRRGRILLEEAITTMIESLQAVVVRYCR